MKGYTYICNMKRYRIKQISVNQFIPQVQESIWDMFSNDWNGIEYLKEGETQTWYTESFQWSYCIVPTLERAKEIIEDHKQHLIIKNNYPKYHKI